MRVRLAPQARADLDSIWFYLARESGSVDLATRTINAITGKFGLLSKFPYIGASQESEHRSTLRSFPVSNHLIFYSVKPGEIRILRVIHASRDAFSVFSAG
jgi:toxin ParE1/3/4